MRHKPSVLSGTVLSGSPSKGWGPCATGVAPHRLAMDMLKAMLKANIYIYILILLLILIFIFILITY